MSARLLTFPVAATAQADITARCPFCHEASELSMDDADRFDEAENRLTVDYFVGCLVPR